MIQIESIPSSLGYPLGLFPLDYDSKNLKPKKEHRPTIKQVEHWISERVFPFEREGGDKLLENLGLEYYDPWEIAKKTNGVTPQDYYWFSEDPNDKFEKVHPRAEELRDSDRARLKDMVESKFLSRSLKLTPKGRALLPKSMTTFRKIKNNEKDLDEEDEFL